MVRDKLLLHLAEIEFEGCLLIQLLQNKLGNMSANAATITFILQEHVTDGWNLRNHMIQIHFIIHVYIYGFAHSLICHSKHILHGNFYIVQKDFLRGKFKK